MARSCSNSGFCEPPPAARRDWVSLVSMVVSSLCETPSVEERTADLTKERLIVAVSYYSGRRKEDRHRYCRFPDLRSTLHLNFK